MSTLSSSKILAEGTYLYQKRWQALFLICLAQFMVIMDTSIIGIALPAIKQTLHYSQSGLHWIFNAYVITFGGLLLLGGKLADVYGARKLFLLGFGILGGASLLAGLAWDDVSLNASRALQGIGAAFIAPASLTLLMTTFRDPAELGKAMGLWGASAAAGGTAGVFLGGVITEWMDWRWVFLINLPLCLLPLWLGQRVLADSEHNRSKIDFLGALFATIGLTLLVFGLVSGAEYGWATASTLGSLLVSAVTILAFLARQMMQKQPLLPLSIFRLPNLSAANMAMLLLAAAWIPLWFFLNLYLQQVLRLSAFEGGLALLPMTVAIMVMMMKVTPSLIARFGYKGVMVMGYVLLAIALFMLSGVSSHGSYWADVFAASIIAAGGMSLAYIPTTMLAMGSAQPEQSGLASGIINTSYQVGSAIGLALMTALAAMVHTTGAHTEAEALTQAFSATFLGAMVIVLLALIPSVLIRTQRNA